MKTTQQDERPKRQEPPKTNEKGNAGDSFLTS